MPKNRVAPAVAKRITVHLDRKAAELITLLQLHYGTTQAELLRRALDHTHTMLYNHRPLTPHYNVVPSTAEPMLVNFFLPSLLLDNSTYQARKLEISFPEYVRRAVIEYCVPTIRSMFPSAQA